MHLITWTPQLSVGVQPIDNDHKLLVSLINQLYYVIEDGQDRETVGSVLNAFCEYAEYHFEREEMLMRVCGYPDLKKHKKAHDAVKVKVNDVHDDYAKSENMDLSEDVLDFIRAWFVEHLQKQDKLYQPFMEGKEQEIEVANRAFQDKLEEKMSES